MGKLKDKLREVSVVVMLLQDALNNFKIVKQGK
jgi:hypothetical protein